MKVKEPDALPLVATMLCVPWVKEWRKIPQPDASAVAVPRVVPPSDKVTTALARRRTRQCIV